MWKKINDIFNNPIIQLLGIPGAIAVITWVTTTFSKLPIWEIWLAIIFSIGCVFWILNQFNAWRERYKRGFPSMPPEQIEATIRGWFDKRHYSSSVNKVDNTLFYVVGMDPQKRSLIVFKPTKNPSVILIRLIVNEEDIGQNIPQPYQSLARFNIGVEMARIGLKCHPKPPMHIEQELQCDEFLIESSFWNAVDKIRQGHVLIGAHLSLASIQAKLEKEKPSSTGQAPDKEGSQT